MSEWMGKNIANGMFIPIAQDYDQGYIKNKSTGLLEFYASSYEKERMKQLNEQNVSWTKNHKIKIQYKDKIGIARNYIPDILVGRHTLEEIKPQKMLAQNNNPEKFAAATQYCNNRNIKFNILTEKELGIKI